MMNRGIGKRKRTIVVALSARMGTVFHQVSNAAQKEHVSIRPGDILLAFVRCPSCDAFKLLQEAASPQQIEAQLQTALGKSGAMPRNPVWVGRVVTRSVRDVLRKAEMDARGAGKDTIGTGEILVALLKSQDEVIDDIIRRHSVIVADIEAGLERISTETTPLSEALRASVPLTPRAEQLIELSKDVARQIGENIVSPLTLLLVLARDRGGLAGNALRSLGLTQQHVLLNIRVPKKESVAPVPHHSEPTFAASFLTDAAVEARRLNNKWLGTEHLLLALLRGGRYPSVLELLATVHIPPDELVAEVERLIRISS